LHRKLSTAAYCVGNAFSALTGRFQVQCYICLTLTCPLVVAGFLLRWEQIPKYWIWIAYINFLRYAWGGLMINQVQGQNAKIGQYDLLEYYSLDGENKWLFLLYEFICSCIHIGHVGGIAQEVCTSLIDRNRLRRR
jgi:hypothetical protein